jgi:hypothetical protein
MATLKGVLIYAYDLLIFITAELTEEFGRPNGQHELPAIKGDIR